MSVSVLTTTSACSLPTPSLKHPLASKELLSWGILTVTRKFQVNALDFCSSGDGSEEI